MIIKRFCVAITVAVGSLGAVSGQAQCLGEQNGAHCRAAAQACAGVVEDAARLACFDALFTRGAAAASAGPASPTATAAVGVGNAKTDIEAAFPPPAEAQQKTEVEDPVLHSTLVSFKRDAHNRYYLRLANGHVWREKETSRLRYKKGDAIRIEKGALGSNQLYVADGTQMVRVERVK